MGIQSGWRTGTPTAQPKYLTVGRQAICSCGQTHTRQLPQGVRSAVQFGPRFKAAMGLFEALTALVARGPVLMAAFNAVAAGADPADAAKAS